MAKRGKKKSKKAARVAPAKLVSLKTPPKQTQKKPPAGGVPATAGQPAAQPETALARLTQLEADRTNLMAQVAWARGVAQEQQKALEIERKRAEQLASDLEAQRARVEQLKALSLLDRLLGRHKGI